VPFLAGPAGTRDLTAFGKVWALTKGPYGRTLALVWDEGVEARVVDVAESNVHWTLPDSVKLWPHDIALGAAAMPLTGAGDRMLALYVAPLCASCGPLEKYVLVQKDFGAPATEQSTQPLVLPPGQRPPLAHAGSGFHAAHGAAGQGAAHQHDQHGGKATESDSEDEQEQKEQQGEEKVVQEEAAEDQQEVEKLHDPQVLQELKQQLAELQHKIEKVSGESSGTDDEGFAVFRTKARSRESDDGGMGTWGVGALMLIVGMAAAGMVFFAYQKLNGQQRHLPVVQQQPVGNGVLYSQSCATDEESEVVTDRETARLVRR
jgi:hypothetical protein